MPSLNQQLSPHEGESRHMRRIVIAVLVAAVVVGLVLLAIYGGTGGSAPGY
jgi:cell division protein FtsB